MDVACDGLEGLERLRAGLRPGVVLLDLRMPHLDGEQLLAAIRADPGLEDIPVVTMTAGSGPGPSQAQAHLAKPFDLDDLSRIVLSLCAPG